MNVLEDLEKIVKLGGEISKSKGKDTFLYYLNEMMYKGFNKELFELLMLRYNLLKQEYIDILPLLKEKEVLKLLITSILHPN